MTSSIVADLTAAMRGWADGFAERGASFGTGLDLAVFLLALRIDHERTREPYNQPSAAPEGRGWGTLTALSGSELTSALKAVHAAFTDVPNTLGQLARVPAIPDEPAHLAALIAQIDTPDDAVGGPWTANLPQLAEAFDRLLVEAGNDGKVPLLPTARAVAAAITGLLNVSPDDRIVDPAAGSGGLLVAARQHQPTDLTRSELMGLRDEAFAAQELRPDTARWCTFNLLLHGIGTLASRPVVDLGDTLATAQPAVASIVVTNPEFGRQQESLAATLTEGSRSDIDITGNRQLDMLQHVMTMLKPGGRAAVVLPDNVLFDSAGATIRKRLLDTCDLHTILRLPTGISAKGSVKTNVLFFDKKPAREEPWTTATWIYDLRTNRHFTLKRNKMTAQHLTPFVDAFQADDRSQREESERFKSFSYDELTARDQVNLDITWLKDDAHLDADDLPDPDVLAAEIADELFAAATMMSELADELGER